MVEIVALPTRVSSSHTDKSTSSASSLPLLWTSTSIPTFSPSSGVGSVRVMSSSRISRSGSRNETAWVLTTTSGKPSRSRSPTAGEEVIWDAG